MENPFEQYIKEKKIDWNGTTMTVNSVIDLFNRKRLNLSPVFQRRFVWTKEKARLLILSILENFPIPPIIVYEKPEGTYEIIDGQQRITSILWFVGADVEPRRTEGELEVPIREIAERYGLSTKDVKELLLINPKEKPVFKNLKKEYTNRILDYHLSFLKIKNTNENGIYDLFTRINMGAVRLYPMEIRNAMFYSPYVEDLKRISSYQLFRKLVPKRAQKRMKDIQLVLIFDAFKYGFIKSRKPEGGYISLQTSRLQYQYYLNQIMKNRKKFAETDPEGYRIFVNTLEHEFKEAIYNVYLVFGENSFRLYDSKKRQYKGNSSINEAVFQIEAIPLSEYPKDTILKNKQKIKELYENIMSEYRELFEASTSSFIKIVQRFNIIYSKIYGLLGTPKQEMRTDIKYKRELWNNYIKHDKRPICAICGQPIQNFEDAELDHIIPYSIGGETKPSNLRLVHIWCNRRRK